MTVEIGLRNVGDTVEFHNGLNGNIVSMISKTFPDHPFTVNVNGDLMQYDHFGNPLFDNNPIIVKVISRPKEKKIIQISTAMTQETERCFGEHVVTALCDDGSVYVKFNDNNWEKLPPILKD